MSRCTSVNLPYATDATSHERTATSLKHSGFFKALFGVLLAIAFVFQGTWALAGTTGSISGSLTDSSNGKPIADATITASSPSQTASAKTDASGHFAFLSLAPDTYTVSANKGDYSPISIAGITVFADQSQTLALTTSEMKTIARITSRASGNLVKSGTTSDVYSVNAATQQVISSVGGGYNMNQAYSGIYSQPGVTSYVGNYGQGQVFYIRGASYGQTGYEFDGVPVNRAFDNYNGNTLSNLGQQELQVYTGGSPAGGSSATLGGYINQVIKTGTYPGFGTITGGIGAPTFYHQLQVETGGASPNRLFSYYAGFGGYNQDYRDINNQNGGNINPNGMNPYGFFGTESNIYAAFNTGFYGNGPFPACPNLAPPADATGYPVSGLDGKTPMCLAYGPMAAGFNTTNSDREFVTNLHFGIPHKYDSGRDDVQLLYDIGAAHSVWADSINDLGGVGAFQNLFSFIDPSLAKSACFMSKFAAGYGYSGGQCANGGPSPFPYQDGYIFAPGTQFGQNAATANVIPYYFPSSPTNRQLYSGIPADQRDAIWNDMAIVKLQYQKNIGSNAYARVYGYSFYSDWLQNGPNEASLYYGLAGFGFGDSGDYPSPDYELMTHTRGASFEYANQINSQNLIRFTANYVTAGLNRFNNQTWLANSLKKTSTNLVDANGNCVSFLTGAIASCFSSSTAGTYGDPTRATYCAANTCNVPAGDQWIVTQPQGRGTLNNVTPKFTTFALEDEFHPTDKWDLNLGVRLERYQYDLANSNDPMNNFWFNAADQVYCYDPATGQPQLNAITANNPPPASPITTAPGAPCPTAPSGQQGVHPDGQNGHLLYSAVSAPSFAYNVFSPRVSGTYTVDPNTVLRFSFGRYTQPTPAAFEQYLDQAGRYAAQNDFSRFFGFGFTNPGHNNPVQTSNNADFSWEQRLNGTDVTFKVSPFYRYTTHQSVSVPLGPNFASAVNLGTQRSMGVEFQVQKGDPTRDGLSGAISYTYTDAKIRYENAPNGFNAIDTLNNYIQAYNALTKGPKCYTNTLAINAATGAPYVASSAADPNCTNPDSIVNPYSGLPQQKLLARDGWYPTFPNAPPEDAPAQAGASAISPNFFTGWLNYKHGRFAIAPNFVLAQGQQYGEPTSIYGLDPRTCTDNQAGANGVTPPVAGVGAQYGQYANYYSCGASLATESGYLAIPDPYTGSFDGVGQYREPWTFNVGAMLRYDISPKVTATLNLANLYNTCFGGSSTSWSKAFPANNYVCGYTDFNAYAWTGTQPGAGFFYGASPTDPANGTVPFSKALLYPYSTVSGALPFQAYLQVQVKL